MFFHVVPVCSDTMAAEQRLLSVPELSHHLAESYLTCCLYLQEMLQYKRQNHGKVQAKQEVLPVKSSDTPVCSFSLLFYML